MVRRDKSTPNADAAHTLIVGLLIALLIFVGAEPLIRVFGGAPQSAEISPEQADDLD